METIGKYVIEEQIGRGGMGYVFRARDPQLGRTAAVKVVNAQGPDRDEFRARLLREARTASGLDHDAIVKIWDVGEDKGCVFIAMQFINGLSLDRRPAAAIAPDSALRILARVGSALDYAHASGVIHRDVKPANIIIDTDGFAHLCDFGIARAADGGDQITRTGFFAGTPSYMSPEQLCGEMGDRRSDEYALAVVGYELLTGSRPFDASNRLTSMPRPAHEANPALPPAASDVFAKALARDPAKRYAACMEMVSALSRAVEGRAGGAVRTRVRPRRASVSRWVMIGAAASIVVALGFALLVSRRQREPGVAGPVSHVMATKSAPGSAPPSSVAVPPAPVEHNNAPPPSAARTPAPMAASLPAPSPAIPSAATRYKADWPMFRGNLRRDGEGHVGGPVSPQVAWTASFEDRLSAPVVGDGGRVFVMAGRNLFAVEEGRTLWSAFAGDSTEPAPVVFDDGTVCVLLQSGESRCFNQTGKPAAPRQTWAASSARSDQGETYSTAGAILRASAWKYSASEPFSTAPALATDGDICAGTAAGELICVNRIGQQDWVYRAPVRITGAPAISPSGQVYFGCADRCLYCVRGGELDWRFLTQGAVYSAPVLDRGGVVYFGSDDGFFYAVDHAGALVWKQQLGGEIRSSAAFDRGGHLYVTTINRRLYCLR